MKGITTIKHEYDIEMEMEGVKRSYEVVFEAVVVKYKDPSNLIELRTNVYDDRGVQIPNEKITGDLRRLISDERHNFGYMIRDLVGYIVADGGDRSITGNYI